jgi:predicted dehydrogenase
MAAKRTVDVAMIGSKFMGRAHANAWMSVNRFFDLPRTAVRRTVCAREVAATAEFAERWGFAGSATSWRRTVADPAVDLVDVCTPNHVHAGPSIAALEAGKHVACEKPLAGTLDDARTMRDAARAAARRGLRTFVWFNYRRCPAVAHAHRLVRAGKLGRIFHVRAQYLQDWGGPETPLVWRFKGREAGSGAHGDLNAHIIDMARFITGDEIAEVCGAIEETFVRERRLPDAPAAGLSRTRSKKGGRKRTGRSTVDDCVLFLARFKGGATGSFEATRLATGNQNRNTIEINGDKGSLRFDFERMNELTWWDHTLPSALRGWSRIMCTNAGDHPYVDAYWPPAHGLGYEHGFVSQAADILAVLGGKKPVVPLPDFDDAYQTQRVLHAAIASARERRWVRMSEVK